jgi:putative endonuclease
MFYVYVIYSSKFNKYYTGFTQNIEQRLKEHNRGKTKSTKAFVPWELLFFEPYETRNEARQKEKYYKSGVGREKLKNFRKNNLKDF